MVATYPSVTLSANGAVAYVDMVANGFRVISIPGLETRFDGTFQGVVDVTMSAFGEAFGIRTVSGELIVVAGGQRQTFSLPRSRDRIRCLQISESGDRVAVVLAGEPGSRDGTLEVWPLPPGDAPVVSQFLPNVERCVLAADPGLTRIGLVATSPPFRAIYVVSAEHDDKPSLLWRDDLEPLAGHSLVLSDEWAWVTQRDRLLGWQGAEQAATLPGTGGDQLAFSRNGDHLLAWRTEHLVGVTAASVRFRLFDLATLEEVANTVHVIEDDSGALPVVTAERSLLIVRVGRDAEIALEPLAFGEPAASAAH